jgi:hypothetical protein
MWHDLMLYAVCISALSWTCCFIAGVKKPARRDNGVQATRNNQTQH